jgi:tRNA A-37 threonylcarbamoyl transferase component Bud32
MPLLLKCPHGHQWELPTDLGGETAGVPLVCPVCGAVVDPPAVALPASEAETLPPQPALNAEPASAAPTPMPARAVPAAEDRPAVIGYDILEELGRGGMGVVYKARHTRLDRLVAIKILPAEVSDEPAFAERFAREARALAKLNHPHIVSIYDFGQSGEQSYFIMEYVEGANLRQRMRAGRLQPQEALQIIARICDALEYAHEEGIVHRDIKPENILLDKKGRVKIADFGLVKLVARKTAQYTLTGPWQVVGTPHYMAPEQMDNVPILDHRADIYSLGVMLYEMLTGQLPLGRFPPPSHKAPVDAQFDEVVLRALEREPERRYQRVSEMKAALAVLLAKDTPWGERPRAMAREIQPSAPGTPPEATTAPYFEERSADDAPEAIYLEGSPANDALEAVRQRVERPAIGLMISGFISLLVAGLFMALVLPRYHGGQEGLFWLLLLPLVVIPSWLAIRGGLAMRKLESYGLSVCGSVAATIPLSACWVFSLVQVSLQGSDFLAYSWSLNIGMGLNWILSVGLGLWAFLVLTNPTIRAAFDAQERQRAANRKRAALRRAERAALRRAAAPSRVRRFLGRATGWAILFSVVGLIAMVQPLAPLAGLHNVDRYTVDVYGYHSLFGIALALAFLSLWVLLIVTGFMEPIPVWQPLAIMLAGIGILFLTSLFVVMLHFGVGQRAPFAWVPAAGNGRVQQVTIAPMAYVVAALGLGLLLLGAAQLRGVFMQGRERAGTSAERLPQPPRISSTPP